MPGTSHFPLAKSIIISQSLCPQWDDSLKADPFVGFHEKKGKAHVLQKLGQCWCDGMVRQILLLAESTIHQGLSPGSRSNSRLKENSVCAYAGIQVTLEHLTTPPRGTPVARTSPTHSGIPTNHNKGGRVDFSSELAPALKPHLLNQSPRWQLLSTSFCPC